MATLLCILVSKQDSDEQHHIHHDYTCIVALGEGKHGSKHVDFIANEQPMSRQGWLWTNEDNASRAARPGDGKWPNMPWVAWPWRCGMGPSDPISPNWLFWKILKKTPW